MKLNEKDDGVGIEKGQLLSTNWSCPKIHKLLKNWKIAVTLSIEKTTFKYRHSGVGKKHSVYTDKYQINTDKKVNTAVFNVNFAPWTWYFCSI